MSNQVTAISVTFQSAALADSLGATLQRFAHVVIVDNASTDGCADALAKRLPAAALIRNTVNKGFGSANNQGVALVNTPYALLLNPDCEISDEALSALVATAERFPQAAIIAPQGWRG